MLYESYYGAEIGGAAGLFMAFMGYISLASVPYHLKALLYIYSIPGDRGYT